MESAAILPDLIPVPVPVPVPSFPAPSNEEPNHAESETPAPKTAKKPIAEAPAAIKPESVPVELGMFDLILRGQAHLTSVLRREDDPRVTMQRLPVPSRLGPGVHGRVAGFAAGARGEALFAGARGP